MNKKGTKVLGMVIAIALLLTAITATPVILADNGSTVIVEDGNINAIGATTEIDIMLDTAPDGLSGYNMTISLSDPGIAEILSVEFPTWAPEGLYANSTLPADTVWLKAADLLQQVDPGATNVLLATLTIRGDAEGSCTIDAVVTKMDPDGAGDPINPSVDPGSLTVTVPTTYTLMTSSTAGGSVTTPGEDTYTYDEGTVVTLVATPDADYRFVSWTGDVGTIANVNAETTTITMNGDYAIVANFEELPQYDLTVTSTAGGSVTTPGEDTYTYDEGTVVTLVATPDADYRFVSWTGDVGTIANANAATTTITMNGDYAIVANFEEEEEVVRRGGGSYTAADSDSDGFTDIEEILAGTNPNDPKDYPGAAAATATPAPATPTPAPTAVPTPVPTATPAPTAVPATPTPEEPGFEALLAIGGLLAIAFVILRRKQ